MRKAQCINKHFYDADSYTACPHCGAPPMTADIQPTAQQPKSKTGKSKFSFFGGHKNTPQPQQPVFTSDIQQAQPAAGIPHTENGIPQQPPQQQPAPQQYSPTAPPPAINYQPPPQPQQNEQFYDTSHTVSIHRANAISALPQEKISPAHSEPPQSPAPDSVAVPKAAQTPAPAFQPVQQAVQSQSPAPKPAAPNTFTTEQTQQQITGKTIGFFNDGSSHKDPVVGWLVCLKGVNIGTSYELAARKNTIGRLYGNDVVLENEPKVSRESHAIINYDYKKSDFYLQPSNGDNPYVNDEILLSPKKLAAYDKIEIGGCLLMFIPLCGENFTWSDYINEE